MECALARRTHSNSICFAKMFVWVSVFVSIAAERMDVLKNII